MEFDIVEGAEASEDSFLTNKLSCKLSELPLGLLQSQLEASKREDSLKVSKSSRHSVRSKLPIRGEPLELSSKIKPSLSRGGNKRKAYDPRFSDLYGKFDEETFEKSYKFVSQIEEKERETLLTEYKKCKDSGRKEQLKNLLNRAQNKAKSRLDRKRRANLDAELYKKEKNLVEKGKKPFYLKQSEKKKLLQSKTIGDLSLSQRQLEDMRKRKSKRSSMKDKRRMPTRRSYDDV